MALDWAKLEEENGKQYKDYAPAGIHEVKLDKVENRKSSTGTVWQDYYFVEDTYQYPRFSHPISAKNDSWRAYHWKQLFVMFGATEDAARKAVETCESKDSFDKIAAAYEQMANKLAAKHPKMMIECWKDGKYTTGDFASSIRLNRPEDAAPAPASDDPFADTETADDIDESDIPF